MGSWGKHTIRGNPDVLYPAPLLRSTFVPRQLRPVVDLVGVFDAVLQNELAAAFDFFAH